MGQKIPSRYVSTSSLPTGAPHLSMSLVDNAASVKSQAHPWPSVGPRSLSTGALSLMSLHPLSLLLSGGVLVNGVTTLAQLFALYSHRARSILS